MKIHVSELEGRALDYAVAKSIIHADNWSCEPFRRGFLKNYHPSQDWARCGPLLERFSFQICGSSESGYFVYAIARDGHKENKRAATGFHLRQTICRAVVAAKIGEEVEIPDELVT